MQKTDVAHGAELGLVIGGLGGALVGTAVVFIPLLGGSPPLVTILLTALGGAVFGAWVSRMIASSTPNSRLAMFGKDFDEGPILMMVDVPARRVDEIRNLVVKRHPEAAQYGIEPAIPAFP